MLSLPAYAKINLSLEIVRRRDDGFHELVSVMQTVSLADTINLSPSAELKLSCSDDSLLENNLVVRAATLLQTRHTVRRGCTIDLIKSIPVAAGLGGGSSDAASTLLGLARLWNLQLDCGALVEMAAELGSDVPFFLWGGTCLVEGRGERIEPLPASEPASYLLVNPCLAVSTRRVFDELRPDEWSDGERTRRIVRQGPPYSFGPNGLQEALFRAYPNARKCFDDVASVAPDGAYVSGSGPTIFARFPTGADAAGAADELARRNYRIDIVTSITDRTKGTPCAEHLPA